MNKPIRKVTIAISVLFLALFVNLNVVQVFQGNDYRDNSQNRRVLLNEYASPRGQITVGGEAVAESVPSSGDLKYLRKYPDGRVYSTATGFYSFIYNKSGIELADNSVLTGDDPDLFGTRLADILTGRGLKGGSVQLTLNARAQAAAYKAMGNRRGAVVAIDPKTGAILTMLSTPTYDPNLLASHDSEVVRKAYASYNAAAANEPMLNRTISQVYPPGSMFKVVDSAAALAANPKLTPASVLSSPNTYRALEPERRDACPANGEGACVENFDGERCGSNGTTATLALAFAKSCNTTFSELAVTTLQGDRVAAMAQKFGFSAPYNGDQAGDLCNPAAFEIPLRVCNSTPGSTADLDNDDSLAQAAIGQRNVGITPLQAAMLSSAVANNGTLMKPYLVNRELRPDLSVLHATQPEQLDQVLEPERNADLVELMKGVVTGPQGTGSSARIDIDGVVVGGKTGTADHGVRDEKTGKFPPPHAWFTGFALAKGDPKIAVSVLIEEGGVSGNETTGGKAAAPVAKAVMEAYLRSIGVGS